MHNSGQAQKQWPQLRRESAQHHVTAQCRLSPVFPTSRLAIAAGNTADFCGKQPQHRRIYSYRYGVDLALNDSPRITWRSSCRFCISSDVTFFPQPSRFEKGVGCHTTPLPA